MNFLLRRKWISLGVKRKLKLRGPVRDMKVYYVKFKDGDDLYFYGADQKAADEYGNL